MMSLWLDAVLSSLLIGVVYGEASGDSSCASNNWETVYYEGGDVKVYELTQGCKNLYTSPSGYYSPAGACNGDSVEECAEYFNTAWLQNTSEVTCLTLESTVNAGTYYLACQCTEGFLCLNNTALPNFCPKKYYCRQPSVYKECKSGHYCKEGSVYGEKCILASCPAGSSAPGGSGSGTLIFIGFSLFVFLLFQLYQQLAQSKKRKEYIEMEAYLEHLEATLRDAENTINPLNTTDIELVINAENNDKKPTSTAEDVSTPQKKNNEEEFLIEFFHIVYALPNGIEIIKSVTGRFAPGTSTSIMGSSGAGKTTIMNLIVGKVKKSSGIIQVNGEQCESLAALKSKVGFVPQEDIMHRRLTVLDNVTFSAFLRLPPAMEYAEKIQRVRETLAQLKLDHVRHSIIGDEKLRGVSGGQRKRVNVALEMVADPRALFLDEPTSGLDSVSATELASMLGSIAQTRRMTTAAVIHAPSPTAFNAFSHLILLQTGGTLCFAGERADVVPYFSSIGFHYDSSVREEPVADYVLAVMSGREQPVLTNEGESQDNSLAPPSNADNRWDPITGFDECWRAHVLSDGLSRDGASISRRRFTLTSAERASLARRADTSKWNQFRDHVLDSWRRLCVDVKEFPSALTSQCRCGGNYETKERAGFRLQFYLCFKRALKQQYIGFQSYFLGTVLTFFGVGLFIAALIGSDNNVLGAYPADICNKQYPALAGSCRDLQQDDYVSALQFVSFILLGAGAAVSSSTFGSESTIYYRESAAGLNTAAYFFAKFAADIPVMITSALCVFAGLSTQFVSPMPPLQLYAGLQNLFVFAYASGYFLSFILPYESCGLASVGWGVVWGLLFSGLVLVMSDDGDKNLHAISVPRWFNEAVFYASTVKPYSKVRRGPYKGDEYYDFSRTKQYYCFYDSFSASMGYACSITLVWLAIDLFTLTVTSLDKKK